MSILGKSWFCAKFSLSYYFSIDHSRVSCDSGG